MLYILTLMLTLLAVPAYATSVFIEDDPGTVHVAAPGMCTEAWEMYPRAFNPTGTAFAVKFIPLSTVDVEIHVGTSETAMRTSTASASATSVVSGTPTELNVTSLTADTRYVWAARCRVGAGPWSWGATGYVNTLRTSGGGRFLLVSDPHTMSVETQFLTKACTFRGELHPSNIDFNSIGMRGKGNYYAVMEGVRDMALTEPYPDFLIDNGDSVGSVNCGACTLTCTRHGASTTTHHADNVADANLRMEIGYLTESDWANLLPKFMIYGNHNPPRTFYFANKYGVLTPVGHTLARAVLSADARDRFIVSPELAYGATDGEAGYWTFDHGGARFIFLDNFGHINDDPGWQDRVDDLDCRNAAGPCLDVWTFGTVQLAWLNALITSNANQWIFIFQHHPSGGFTTPTNQYFYGRGFCNTTVDGTVSGDFKGEDAIIQATLTANIPTNGAIVVFNGHDHVTLACEKLNSDGTKSGVHYVNIVRPSQDNETIKTGTIAGQSNEGDVDQNGIPDYLEEGKNGSHLRGFLSVEFDSALVRIRHHVGSLHDPSIDGKVMVDYRITGN